MNDYLATIFNKLKSNNYANLNIVIGNESCDLDSAVSSLVYAFFLNWLNRSNTNDIYIAVLDVDREDFPIKTEIAYCFKEHGIDENNIIFRNDIDLHKLTTEKPTKLILVDHHILSMKLNYLKPYVTEIIDHRYFNNEEWTDINKLITIVGSCCTLVCEKIKGNDSFFNEYPVFAELLYEVILLDTVNFSKEVNKGTPLDETNVLYLENILKITNSEEERETKLSNLLAARSDISNLTPLQLIVKDLKIAGDILVPSFQILVKDFLQKPKSFEAVIESLRSKNCDVALLLGMDLKNGLKRDAAIISPMSLEKGEKLAKFLQEWKQPPLQLQSEMDICIYFKQNNLSASRKQYMQALSEFLKS